jgi:hypothetical protein
MSTLAAFGTAVAAFLALIGLLHGLVENKRHHVRDTEAFYLKLYWEMLKDLPDWVVMNQKLPADLAKKKQAEVNELAHRYLRLRRMSSPSGNGEWSQTQPTRSGLRAFTLSCSGLR